jgi:hypothetical protein
MALSPELRKLVSNAANKYSRSSGSRIKPKEGANRYRFFIPEKAEWLPANGQFWADLGVYWIKAEENGKPLAVVGSKSVVYQQPDEIATAIDRAIQTAIDEDSKKLYESWRAKTSILVNVLDRSKGSSNPDEPQILELSPTTWGKVMAVIQQYGDEGEDVLDPVNGIDLIITRSGKGLNTEYSVNVAPGKSQPVPPAALKGSHDLAAHIEKEFFRGDEPKALAAIAQISGVALPRLTSAAGSARTPTAALSSAAAAVEDADEAELAAVADLDDTVVEEVEEVVEEKTAAPTRTAAKATAKAAAVEDEDDVDDILAGLDDL